MENSFKFIQHAHCFATSTDVHMQATILQTLFIYVTDLTEIMATSRDYDTLKAAWQGWFEAAGRAVKDDYEEFVKLSNKASTMDGKKLLTRYMN